VNILAPLFYGTVLGMFLVASFLKHARREFVLSVIRQLTTGEVVAERLIR